LAANPGFGKIGFEIMYPAAGPMIDGMESECKQILNKVSIPINNLLWMAIQTL
jgi:hypothetical protein